MNPVVLQPVGFVENTYTQRPPDGWGGTVSHLVVRPELEEALDGLEAFSHIEVLFWFHEALPQGPLRVHPKSRIDLPLVGVFATRSPQRPNRVGLKVARLLGREGSTLVVEGLDAINGTPLLDIKGYFGTPEGDVRVPEWVDMLRTDSAGSR